MFRRNIHARIEAALSDTPVVLLRGARQVGKTTLARAVAGTSRPFLSLDDLATRAAAQRDPAGFIAGLGGPVVIDEIQRVPDLLFPIKETVDRDRSPGRFLLTGSADVLAGKEVSGLLAGRVEAFTLWPLSQGEVLGQVETFIDRVFAEGALPVGELQISIPDVLPAALAGGYPEALARAAKRRAAWFDSYVASVVEREVRELAQIENLLALPDILRTLAQRAAGLLNIADVARACNLPPWTLTRYLALLEATYLIWRLPAWSRDPSRSIAKAPKIHFGDSGLLAHLLGVQSRQALVDRQLAGSFIESFVAAELLKQATWSDRAVTLRHYRTHPGREVDLVLEDAAGKVVGIEIKSGGTVRAEDLVGLEHLAELLGTRFERGVLLYGGRTAIPFGRHLHALPIAALWAE